MRDELADGDLLRNLVVEVLAVEHHGLQDGQRPLQHGCVHGGLVHVTGNLQRGQRRGHKGNSLGFYDIVRLIFWADLFDEGHRKRVPGNNAMVHQLHKGRQSEGQ